ncbi:MAG: hypothetical protein AAFX51_10380, partial [Cyanobacteria bacterium J06636_28]
QQAVVQSQANQRIARRNLARLLNLPSTLNVNATPVPAPDSWDATYERWELTLEDSILLCVGQLYICPQHIKTGPHTRLTT